MSATDAPKLRKVSRDAFGQDYQLEVMLDIADSSGLVSQTEVADRLGLSTSNVQTAWRRLVALRLLSPVPRTTERSRYHLRSESLAWNWARELAAGSWEVVAAADSADSDPDARK